jgi:hypothetical protein
LVPLWSQTVGKRSRSAKSAARSRTEERSVGAAMPKFDEFLQRQDQGKLQLAVLYTKLRQETQTYIEAARAATVVAVNTPGGREARERAAVQAVSSALDRFERETRSAAREIRETTAHMSADWEEFAPLSRALPKSELPRVRDSIRTWTEMRQSADQTVSDVGVFHDSLEEFRDLGPRSAQAVERPISALDAAVEATREVSALSEASLATLEEVRNRLEKE